MLTITSLFANDGGAKHTTTEASKTQQEQAEQSQSLFANDGGVTYGEH